MQNTMKYAFFTIFFIVTIDAQEIEQQQNRMHSVREVVDSVGEIEIKDVDTVDKFRLMFKKAKTSGQIRLMYADYTNKEAKVANTYATAIGGILKYELAEFNGFNVGVAFYTSQDIDFITGKNGHHNSELSSNNGNYSQLGEAYLNYKDKHLNLRAGRQLLDTPLADSDDIKMIQNTFEAYTASYLYKGFDFLGGGILSWQGSDQDLNGAWAKNGENGTYFGGVSYHDVYEFNLWYYNITKQTNAFYCDFGIEYKINNNYLIHTMFQYLKEDELNNSGTKADIYGGLIEFVVYDIGFNFAFNKSEKNKAKKSFSGTGGGALFTNMDSMILDSIALDREASAFVTGITYSYQDFNFLYAYGSFNSKENSQGEKEHILEQDIGFEYNLNNEFILAFIYVNSQDLNKNTATAYDFDHTQVMLNYNF